MSEELLVNQTIGNVLTVQFAQQHGGRQARLTVQNAVRITGELQARPEETHNPRTSVPDTATQLMSLIVKQLRTRRYQVFEAQTPDVSNDGIRLEATITTSDKTSERLSRDFGNALQAALKILSARRFGRTSDSMGGELAGL